MSQHASCDNDSLQWKSKALIKINRNKKSIQIHIMVDKNSIAHHCSVCIISAFSFYLFQCINTAYALADGEIFSSFLILMLRQQSARGSIDITLVLFLVSIRTSVDALCRDGAGQISRERVQCGRLTRQGTTS